MTTENIAISRQNLHMLGSATSAGLKLKLSEKIKGSALHLKNVMIYGGQGKGKKEVKSPEWFISMIKISS